MGATRVAEIVRAIKEFFHPGPVKKASLDINRAIESTVLVSRNEWKYVADLEKQLDGDAQPDWERGPRRRRRGGATAGGHHGEHTP